MTLTEYIDYVMVFTTKTEPSSTNTGIVQIHLFRETHVPAVHASSNATKKEAMQYTGERKLVGTSMMHKSNRTVFADDDDKTGRKQATEIPDAEKLKLEQKV